MACGPRVKGSVRVSEPGRCLYLSLADPEQGEGAGLGKMCSLGQVEKSRY